MDMEPSFQPGDKVAMLVETQSGLERHGPCEVIEAGKVGAGGGERVLVWTPNSRYRLWFFVSELEPW